MPAPTHHVERLTFEVEVGDMGAAVALRDRVEHLADEVLARTVERLLERFAPTGLTLALDRIEVDLGAFDPDRLEAEAPAALERELTQALTRAIAAQRGAGRGARTAEEAVLEDFEAYLVRGAAPFGGGHAPPGDALQALIAGQPHDLVRMLRRRAGARHVIERLVLQAGDRGFAALLDALSPADAAVILTYLAEMARLHPTTRAPPLAEPVLRRTLRVLTLEYLLRDPGGEFNRLRYVETLVRGLAQAQGVAYEDLLVLLHAALPSTRRRRPVTGSLPGVLGQLAKEAGVVRAEPPPPGNDPIEQAAGDDLKPLLAALRAAAGRPSDLDRLLRRLDGRTFAEVITALEPTHAEVILTYVAGLSEAHRIRPLMLSPEAAFELRLRRLVLRFLLRDAGSSFNRRAWLRQLLQNLAREGGVAYENLLATLTDVVEALKTRAPPRGALPAALAALAADLPKARGRRDLDREAGRRDDRTDAAPSDRMAAAERFLRTGAPTAMGRELAAIAKQRPAAFADLLRRLTRAASGAPDLLIERLLSWMTPDEIAEVLWPDDAGAAAQWASDLAEAEGLDMSSAWTRVLATGLRGETPSPPPAPPELSRSIRDALLRHWLDHGALAWWAPPGVTVDDLQGDLAGRPAAALIALFAHREPERVAARLRRASASAGDEGASLLRTLAPWAFTRGGALEVLSPGASATDLAGLRLGAAVAAIMGDASTLAATTRAVFKATPAIPLRRVGPSEDRVLLAWLSGEGPATAPGLVAALGRKLIHGGRDAARLEAALRRGLGRPEARARMAAGLPHALLVHLVRRVAPGQTRLIDDLIAVLLLAFPGSRTRRALWIAALALALSPPSPRVLADRLIAALATRADGEALRAAAAGIARRHGHAHLAAALAPLRKPMPRRDHSPPPDPELGETHYVANAGLVMFNPLLPQFFKTLEVLSVDEHGAQRITGLEAQSRAVHLLQYLADERTDAPEPELILNKILCGLPPATPIEPRIDLSEADRAACEMLMRTTISNWTKMSLAALRETFLQREGRLRRAEGRWALEVQRKTVDVLTDQISWSIGVVTHAWMPDPIHVTW